MAKFLALALFLSLTCHCSADQPRSYSPEPSYGPANYEYSWNVRDDYSNNNYGQSERSNAGSTSGSYYVALPDGRLQKVTYTVNGDDGYRADVTYEGEAKVTSYQQPQPQASSYKPVQVPAPRTYTPVVTEAPYQPPAPAPPAPVTTYREVEPAPAAAPAPVDSFEPVPQASTVDNANVRPGEIYYKPVENAPEPEVYYKPVENAPAPEVYYKPLPSL